MTITHWPKPVEVSTKVSVNSASGRECFEFLGCSLAVFGLTNLINSVWVQLNIESFNWYEEILEQLERNEIAKK